jgi:hypothetical protein
MEETKKVDSMEMLKATIKGEKEEVIRMIKVF